MKKIITFSLCLIFRWGYSQILPTGVTMLPANKGIHLMYCDSNNNLWNAKIGKGVEKGLGSGIGFLSGSTLNDIFEIRKNQIYFTSDSGLHYFNNSSMSTDNRLTNPQQLAGYKNKLYISSNENKVYFQNGSTYDSMLVAVSGQSITAIYDMKADKNYLWIGTNSGLVKYDGTNFSIYKKPYGGYSSVDSFYQEVLSIEIDKSGKVWVVNKNAYDNQIGYGSSINILVNNALIPITEFYSKEKCDVLKYLPDLISNLNRTRDGNILAGTFSKLFEFTPTDIKEYVYGSNQTRYSYVTPLFNMACDTNNNIYVSDTSFFEINKSQYDISGYHNKIYPGIQFNQIDINDIKASVSNNGVQFVRNSNLISDALPAFEIKDAECASPMYTAGLWLGGLANGPMLHQAAQTYSQTGVDYRPGPIDTVTLSYDSVNAIPFTHIWKINRSTIESFLANRLKSGYVIPDEILTWPAHGTGNFTRHMAPFVDTDKDGVYDPSKGDYPKIKGDQMLWWVFNDMLPHTESGGLPLQVEIHSSCYAYNCSKMNAGDSEYILNRSIFFDYKIINRSLNNYVNFYAGIFNDPDLGNYADDYTGCRVDQNTGYVINGDANDEGRYGYGKKTPVLMCKLLNKKMSGFMYYNNSFDPVNGNPSVAIDFYNYMNSKWQNGMDLVYGGNGTNGSIKTKYMFDNGSNPATKFLPAWNELTAGNSPSDRRFVVSTMDSVLKTGEIFDLEFAYIFVQDTGAILIQNFNNKPMQALRIIDNWYKQNDFPICDQNNSGLRKTDIQMQNISVYPNPSNTGITISAAIPSEQIKDIQLMDISGRALMNIPVNAENGLLRTGMDISTLPAGVYIITIQTANGIQSIKMIKY